MVALLADPALTGRTGDLRVVAPPEGPIPWWLARALARRFAEESGAGAVRAALAVDRAAASLVFDAADVGPLGPGEAGRRGLLEAQAPGFLSHSSQVMRSLRDAIGGLLRPLVAGRRIVVVGGQRLDLHSLALLRRWAADPGAPVVIGVDAEELPVGALWRREAAQVVAMIEGFAASEGGRSSVAVSVAGEAGVAGEVGDEGDVGVVARGLAALEAEVMDEVAVAAALAAIEASWRSFGFTACLRLADRLVARGVALEGAARRRVALLLAMAAYNRQVSSHGESREADEALASLLDRFLRDALDGEDDPLARAHVLYRLALNEGRRRGALDEALALADAAVAEAVRARAPFVEAWARNGRAYVLGRLGRWDEAIAEVEAAFAGSAAPVVGGMASEQAFSRVVLAENLSALNRWSGRAAAAQRWQATCVELARAAGGDLTVSTGWLALLVERGEVAEAEALAEEAVRVAESMLAPNDADYYATWAGELAYRRGDLAKARAAHERAATMSRRLGDGAREAASALSLAFVDLRGGDPAAAEAVFSDLSERSESEAGRAELRGMVGVAAALRGDAEAATAAINAAIGAAVELGERDVLVRVATMAGEASLALGDLAGARGAFAQARALATGEPPAEAHDRLGALAGEFAAGAIDGESVAEALSILDAALGDGESWWLLERLARACVAVGAGAGLEVGVLRARLGQRVDADPGVAAGLARMEAAGRSASA